MCGRELDIIRMLDLIICLAVGVGLYVGYRKGVVRQAVSLVAIVIAVLVSRMLGGAAGEVIAKLIGCDPGSFEAGMVCPVLGHLVVFLLVWWGAGLIGLAIHKVAKTLKIGLLDSLAGALLMAVKVLIAASILINLWMMTDEAFTDGRRSPGGQIVRLTAQVVPDLLGYVENCANR